MYTTNENINIIKEQICANGIDTLLTRMKVLFSDYELSQLTKPMIISAEIIDMEKVISIIKQTYTCFEIKDVKINLKSQNVCFKIYGSCYVPEKYRNYIVMEWSLEQTEEYNYLKTIKEEYAEENVISLTKFIDNGIKVEFV